MCEFYSIRCEPPFEKRFNHLQSCFGTHRSLPPEFCTEHGTIEAIFGFIDYVAAYLPRLSPALPAGMMVGNFDCCIPDRTGSKGGVVHSGSSMENGPGRTDDMNASNSDTSNVKSPDSGPRNLNEKSVGDALRAVYREAVGEQVPDSMLDLLSKLD